MDDKKPLLYLKHISVYLLFTKDYMDQTEGYWKKWRMGETKL